MFENVYKTISDFADSRLSVRKLDKGVQTDPPTQRSQAPTQGHQVQHKFVQPIRRDFFGNENRGNSSGNAANSNVNVKARKTADAGTSTSNSNAKGRYTVLD